MRPVHLSRDAGQIVNVDDKIKTLSDYIIQVQASDKLVTDFKVRMHTFNSWWKEYTNKHGCPPAVVAAEAAWNAAREDL